MNETWNYKKSGVDIKAADQIIKNVKLNIEKTHKIYSQSVLTGIGAFGAAFDLSEILKNYSHPVLVQSVDGVGTKMLIAQQMGVYENLGEDLLSATANDIAVLGAKPLTLLDYIATDRLNQNIVEKILISLSQACEQHQVALIGGEIAEMPNVYLSQAYDFVGSIMGVVERSKLIDGSKIKAGDFIYALPSSGLHTNGYSLARKLILDVAKLSLDQQFAELEHKKLGEVLLTPHKNYTEVILDLVNNKNKKIHGMAHITGGGLLENLPRILASHLTAEINLKNYNILPIFKFLKKIGNLSNQTCYQTFNMGIGLIIISPEHFSENELLDSHHIKIYKIGKITENKNNNKIIIDYPELD